MQPKQLIIIIWLFLGNYIFAQDYDMKVMAKVNRQGLLMSRVVSFDSVFVMDVKTGSLTYELYKGKELKHKRTLTRGDTLTLSALNAHLDDYYLNEMTEIILDPDQPVTMDDVYPFLYFLSHFTFEGAKWMGLGTEDQLEAGHDYVVKYTLNYKNGKKKALGQAEILRHNWPTVYPIPPAPNLICGNRSVELRLEAESTKGVYFGFNAQRRKAGTSDWSLISDVITINPYQDDKYGKYRYHYMLQDSLPENHVVFEYRVVGRDYFGEDGPVSETDACYGWQHLGSNAIHDRYVINQDSFAQLFWTINEEVLPKVRRVDLMISLDSVDGNYALYKADIDVNSKELEIFLPKNTNYLMYKTVPHFGDSVYSVPFAIQRWDTEPPATPVNLKGTINEKGEVTLAWDMNPEPDFWGYRLFYGNNKTDEFSLLTSTIITTNTWKDTINLNNLTPEIYYKLTALDWRGNTSPFSEILTITKPDTLPPAPAFIKQIKQYKNSDGVILLAVGGGSRDLAKHILFKKELNDASFYPIDTVGIMSSDTILYDKLTTHDRVYEYYLLAIDKSGNETPSETATIEVMQKGLLKGMKSLVLEKDTVNQTLQFKWDHSEVIDGEIELYRTNEKNQLTLYKVIPTHNGVFKESPTPEIFKNRMYKARVVYADGSASKITEIPEALIH